MEILRGRKNARAAWRTAAVSLVMVAAIAAAVHDAAGVWINTLPLTPDRVWDKLQEGPAA